MQTIEGKTCLRYNSAMTAFIHVQPNMKTSFFKSQCHVWKKIKKSKHWSTDSGMGLQARQQLFTCILVSALFLSAKENS